MGSPPPGRARLRDAPAPVRTSPHTRPWPGRLVHLSGITPALSDSCRQLCEELAARARELGVAFSLDVNYRAKLWSVEEARSCLESLASGADLLIVGQEDARDLFGLDGDPRTTLAALVERTGARSLVLTLGSDGAAFHSPEMSGLVPGVSTTIIDRLGAGDAFTAGDIDGFLAGDLERGVRSGPRWAPSPLVLRATN